MKKIVTKFWGVALIVMLLSTLFVAATPVSAADPLAFNTESIPGTAGNVLIGSLVADSDVIDFAVGSDGATIYAGLGTGNVYKSTNAGVSWVAIATGHDVDLVAVASDSTDVVLTIDTTSEDMRLSLDGGSTWSDFDTTTSQAATGTIVDVDLSQSVNSVRYAAFATNAGEIYSRRFGNAWDEWVDTSAAYTGEYANRDVAYALQFSPNFQGDRSLVAVTGNSTTDVKLEVLVYSATPLWNGETNYPASIVDYAGAEITGASDASLALSPDYPGAGEVESVAFVGITSTDDTEAGVYRMDDYTSSALKRGVDIYSVAFDGSVVVAGTTAAVVWRSENPLDASPTFSGNANLKGPGGASNTIVAFADTSVVAGTSGAASAFSVSTDNGRSFADISLIDSAITDISDVAVSADGTIVYLLTSDNGTTPEEVSLFRYNGAWQRVLVDTTAGTDWIVRINPANPNTLYVADTGAGSTTLYYSAAGGDTRWFSRSGPGLIDMAVESDSVVYAGIASTATVMKSTNAGRFFNDAVATKLAAGNVNTIKVLSENNVIVGSSAGAVSYSTDGNTTWTAIPTAAPLGIATIAIADGLAAGGHVYASQAGLTYMWTIGQAVTDGWKWVGTFGTPAADAITGMEMNATGGLWASLTTTWARNSMPWFPELGFVFWTTPYYNGGTTATTDDTGFVTGATFGPIELSSTATYMKVWLETGATLYSYMDALVLTKPTAVAPLEGYLAPINTTSNLPYNITFTWTRPSLATRFNLWIALDPMFTQNVVTRNLASNYAGTQSFTLSSTLETVDRDGDGTNDNIGTINSLVPGTTYYWTVSAGEPVSSGFSAFPGLSFTIEAGAASVPGISSPANGGTITAGNGAFSWTPVTGTTEYVFELSDSPDFTNIIYTVNAANAGVLLPGTVNLTTGKIYFWRVKALKPVEGPWSTIANFTVAAPSTATTSVPPSTVTSTVAPTTTTSTVITIPPPTETVVNPAYIWAIIVIGAILVIAVIVLIVRTRRSV